MNFHIHQIIIGKRKENMLPPILLLLALVIVIVAAIVGLVRGFKRYLPSLIVIAGSAVVAFVATLILKSTLGSVLGVFVRDLIEQSMEPGALESIEESMPTVAGLIDALPAALIAPFIFAVLFGVILVIAEIIRAIVMAVLRKKSAKKDASESASAEADVKKAKRNNRLLGLAAGTLGGLVLAFAFLLPLIGYVGMLSEAVDDITETSPEVIDNIFADEESREIYDNFVVPILKDPYVKVSYAVGGKLVFNGVSTINVNGTLYPFGKIVTTGCSIYGHITPFLGTEPADYDDAQIEAVEDVIGDVDGDALLTNVCAEFISGLANAWENGEDFLGIPAVQVEGYFEPVMNTLISAFSSTNDELIVEDLRVVGDILTAFIRYDAIVVMNEENGDIQTVLATPGFVTDVCTAVQKNERMQPVFFEVAKLGVVLVSDVVGIPNDPAAIYNHFLDSLAEEVSGALPTYYETGDSAFFDKTLKTTFEKNGIKLSADAISAISKQILAKMTGDSFVDAGDIRRFFSDELLPALDTTAEYYADVQKLALDVKEGKLTSSLSTLEEIVAQMHETDPSDAESESQKFESVVSSAILVSDSLNGEEKNFLFAVDAQSIEDVVVNLSRTETFCDAVSLLLKGICQSDMLIGTGFSGDTLYNDIIAGGYDNIANTLETVKHAVKMFETLSASKNNSGSGDNGGNGGSGDNKEEEKADITEELGWLVSNMTPASSAIISSQITEETVKNYGVSDESAAPVSDLMTNMFDSMANETEMTEEEYKTESDAISHLFTVATEISSSDTSESIFSGSISSASDITETVLNSKVVSDALVKTAFDEEGTLKEDPLAVNANLNETDKADMIDALNTYSQSNIPNAEDPEAEIQKISALAAVFNLNIEIDANGNVTQKAQ